ncbi:MAG: 30S ribosomal protein S7 [Candidatus Levybacteria bacterium RIFCSPLOWO2_01_FULL_38_21]|nr:MAG: 30S ribosomal protein S7 [Candidatus Levybacteria bacterium RIFCSPLOWO2_01_FULL_38_21]
MRGKKAHLRQTEPDKIYKSRLVTKFINSLMRDGKKTVAQKLFYDALGLIEKQGKTPLEVFEKAVSNVGPRQEVKARRVGGASYQVPIEVRGDRRLSLAVRWIIQAATSRSNKEFHTFSEKLAAEFLDALENKGEAIKKRDIVQRMADANRAFAHFRW